MRARGEDRENGSKRPVRLGSLFILCSPVRWHPALSVVTGPRTAKDVPPEVGKLRDRSGGLHVRHIMSSLIRCAAGKGDSTVGPGSSPCGQRAATCMEEHPLVIAAHRPDADGPVSDGRHWQYLSSRAAAPPPLAPSAACLHAFFLRLRQALEGKRHAFTARCQGWDSRDCA